MPKPDTEPGVDGRGAHGSFRPYRETDRTRIEALFDEFQDYFVPLDSLGR
jgi:hypothetical protein